MNTTVFAKPWDPKRYSNTIGVTAGELINPPLGYPKSRRAVLTHFELAKTTYYFLPTHSNLFYHSFNSF